MNKYVSFVLVGLGHIGSKHAALIQAHPDAELVGVIDTDETKSLAGTPFFNSVDSFISSGVKADVAVLALPNGLHRTHAMNALAHGLHVLIEKPMGLKASECEEIIDQAALSNKHVFVVKQNRYSPPAQWMKEVVDSGKLGQIYEVHIRCFWNRDHRYYQPGPKTEKNWRGSLEYDGGVLFTQFSHFIDVMYWVFGDIDNISTRLYNHNHGQNTEFPDSGMVHFDFVRGGVGSMQFSTSVFEENMESSMTVIAEKGAFKIGGQYMDKLEFARIADYQLPEIGASAPPNDYGGYKGSAGNHALVLQNVLDVLNHQAQIATGGAEGMKVVDMIERIYKAANTNK